MRSLFFILVSCVSGILFAQNDSLMIETDNQDSLINRAHLISVDGFGSIPFLYQIGIDEPYFHKEKSGSLVNKKPMFEYGVRVSYTNIRSKRFGIGAEIGIDKFKIVPAHLNRFGVNEAYHEMLDVLTYSIIPKVELRKKKKANIPHDFSSQLGIGITFTNVIERDYLYDIIDEYDLEPFKSRELYNYDHNPFIGITLLYALNYRVTLSDKLLLNLGTRFTLNGNFKTWPFKESANDISDPNDNKYWISRENMRWRVNGNRVNSLVNLNIGLTYLIK